MVSSQSYNVRNTKAALAGARAFFAAAVATVGLGNPLPADAAGYATGYATAGTCAGFPRISVQVPPGWCAGLVADASAGLRFPRRLLEVSPGRFWLVDMGGWDAGRGRLLELALPASGAAQPVPMKVLADKLDRPFGIALGPDGKVYVGEAGRVWRTAPTGPIAAETVLDGLPADGAHPLKEIVFGDRGRLFVNVGSSTDACRDAAGRQALPCADTVGARPRAAVYEAVLGGPALALQSFVPFATGLRNSVALAWVAGSGTLLQGENSVDYGDEGAPPEELNVLTRGADYGWPGCVGARQPARGYEGRADCARSAAPALLWPAHAAPLQMIAVPATAKNAFAGQLVVAWHGYRAGGHRIVSYALDAAGKPTGAPRPWLTGWDAARGVRPMGTPAGILVDSSGRLLVVEDRNRTLLVLSRESP